MPSAAYPLTIYYDASCPLCAGEMGLLRQRDTRGQLVLVDASRPGFASPLPGVSQAELLACIHARRADGQVVRGVDVFVLAYQAAGLNTVARTLRWPLLRPLLDAAYPWLARYRHRLPRAWVGLWLRRMGDHMPPPSTLPSGSPADAQAIRRAAERAAGRRCDAAGACRIPAQD